MYQARKSNRTFSFDVLEDRRLMAADGFYTAAEVIEHAGAAGKNAVEMVYNPRTATLSLRELTPNSETKLVLQPWTKSPVGESSFRMAFDSETVLVQRNAGSRVYSSIVSSMTDSFGNPDREIDGTISFPGGVKKLSVALGGGNDSLDIQSYVPTYDQLDPGAAHSLLSLEHLKVFMGGGDDNVSVSDIFTSRGTSIFTSDGNDSVHVANVTTPGKLLINTGRGDDYLRLSDTEQSRDLVPNGFDYHGNWLVLQFGAGQDTVEYDERSLQINEIMNQHWANRETVIVHSETGVRVYNHGKLT